MAHYNRRRNIDTQRFLSVILERLQRYLPRSMGIHNSHFTRRRLVCVPLPRLHKCKPLAADILLPHRLVIDLLWPRLHMQGSLFISTPRTPCHRHLNASPSNHISNHLT